MISQDFRLYTLDKNGQIISYIELDEEIPFGLNFDLADIRDISKRKGGWSNTVKPPMTNHNDIQFGELYDINSDFTFFNPNIKTNIQAVFRGEVLFTGYLQLKGFEHKTDSNPEGNRGNYICQLVESTVDFVSEIEEKTLKDLNLDEFNHEFNFDNITSSWTSNYENGYYYGMYNHDSDVYKTEDWYPGVYYRKVVESILNEAGFALGGSIKNVDQFNKEVIPYSGDGEPKISEAEATERKFRAGITGSSVDVHAGTFSNDGVIGSYTLSTEPRVPFNDDSSGDNFDNNSNFSSTQSQWDLNINGDFNIYFKSSFSIILDNPGTTASIVETGGSGLPNPTLRFIAELIRDHNGTETVLAVVNTVGELLPDSLDPGENILTQQINFTGLRTNVPLNNNDKVFIRVRSKIIQAYNTATNISAFYYEQDSDSTDLDITFKMRFSDNNENYFYNRPLRSRLRDGDTVNIVDFLPGKLKQKDIIDDLVKRYNCFITVDQDNPKLINFDPRPNFYSTSDTVNWTDKKDRKFKDKAEFIPELQSKQVNFTYTGDDDFPSKSYEDETGYVYGNYLKKFSNEFTKGEKEIKSKFSSSPLDISWHHGAVLPGNMIDNNKGLNTKDAGGVNCRPRVLYSGGLIDLDDSIGSGYWTFEYIDNNGDVQIQNYSQYPYMGHLDNPFTPTLDTHFGKPAFSLYVPTQWPSKNMYNTYWRDYMESLEDGLLMTMKFDLSPEDVIDIIRNWGKKIYVYNSYYYLNKIKQYNPMKNLKTTVELLKIRDGIAFKGNTQSFNGGEINEYIPPRNPGFLSTSNSNITGPHTLTVGRENTEQRISGSQSDLRTGVFIGEGNVSGSEKFFIFGDDNQVTGKYSSVMGSTGVTLNGDNTTLFNVSPGTYTQEDTIFLGDNFTIDSNTGETVISGSVSFNGSVDIGLPEVLENSNNSGGFDIIMGTGTDLNAEDIFVTDRMKVQGTFYTDNITSITGNYGIDGDEDHIILCDSSGGAFAVKYPTPFEGQRLIIKDIGGSASTNNISIGQGAGVTSSIDGSSDYTMDIDYISLPLIGYNGNWYII